MEPPTKPGLDHALSLCGGGGREEPCEAHLNYMDETDLQLEGKGDVSPQKGLLS